MSSSLPFPALLDDASLTGTSQFVPCLRVALFSAARYGIITRAALAAPLTVAQLTQECERLSIELKSMQATQVMPYIQSPVTILRVSHYLKSQNILLSKKIQRNALEICQLTQECERLSIELKTTQVMPSIQSPVTILRVSHVLFCPAPLTLHYHAPFSPLLISLDPALHPSPFNAESRRCSYSFSNRSSS